MSDPVAVARELAPELDAQSHAPIPWTGHQLKTPAWEKANTEK